LLFIIKMPKKVSHATQLKKKYYPLVSVCTPTFNRRPFLQTTFECFRNQTYPKDRIEWIIVDDGTDKVGDVIKESGISQIKYFEVEKKMTLGSKRNLMHSHCKGSIIVYMDDDDYYPPDRVEHAVETLLNNPKAMCAGSSEIHIYFKHIKKMIQFGPYGASHATAGTFAFRAELLKTSKYEEHAALAEERAFLKDYTVPFVQLNPMKTILCFSHEHNTFDKRRLLEAGYNEYMKESPKKVEDFIKKPDENKIKKFFMEDIDGLLAKYEPGEPKMKPDVLKQIDEILAERHKLLEAENAKNGKIMLNVPGQEPIEITPSKAIEIIRSQSEEISRRGERIAELEDIIKRLQIMLNDKKIELSEALKSTNTIKISKSDPSMKISDFL
jgi:glycosyltransferase involved in cell wall biosynthesis